MPTSTGAPYACYHLVTPRPLPSLFNIDHTNRRLDRIGREAGSGRRRESVNGAIRASSGRNTVGARIGGGSPRAPRLCIVGGHDEATPNRPWRPSATCARTAFGRCSCRWQCHHQCLASIEQRQGDLDDSNNNTSYGDNLYRVGQRSHFCDRMASLNSIDYGFHWKRPFRPAAKAMLPVLVTG
jgi:hypothetical protein